MFAFNHILLSRNIKSQHPVLSFRLDSVASFSPAFSYKLNKISLYTWLDKTFCVIIAVKVKYSGNKPTHYIFGLNNSLFKTRLPQIIMLQPL